VNFILDFAHVAKIIGISTPGDDEEASDSIVKKSCIELDVLALRSTALLFWENCRYIPSNDYTVPRTANEFLELVEPPFLSHTNDLSIVDSKRRTDIFERMGNGLPSKVIAAASTMSYKDFTELMNILEKPEIRVHCLSELESELRRWTVFVDLASKEGNWKRSMDLQAIIDELEETRRRFRSLSELEEAHRSKKTRFQDAVDNRRYDVANALMKDILGLKKAIRMEKEIPTNLAEKPKNIMNHLQAQVSSLVDTIEYDDSSILTETKTFEVDCDGHSCTFLIYSGSVFDPKKYRCVKSNQLSRGIVCWSNEVCDLESTTDGKALLDLNADKFKECITKLPIVEETQNDSVRCVTGKSVILNNISSSTSAHGDNAETEVAVILTVGPFTSPSGQIDALLERDNHYQHFGKITLRSCYRSCVARANQAGLQVMAIRPLTTRTKRGPIYEETLRIALRILSGEAKFSSLREVHVIAESRNQATHLVEMMEKMGYNALEEKL